MTLVGERKQRFRMFAGLADCGRPNASLKCPKPMKWANAAPADNQSMPEVVNKSCEKARLLTLNVCLPEKRVGVYESFNYLYLSNIAARNGNIPEVGLSDMLVDAVRKRAHFLRLTHLMSLVAKSTFDQRLTKQLGKYGVNNFDESRVPWITDYKFRFVN